jgi:hypothetical protein
MRKIITISIAFSLLGCVSNPDMLTKSISRDAYLQTLDSAEWQKSLITWTSDTAFTTNAELMLLLDTLYQHVREDKFPSEVRTEEKWMSEYRSRLCTYYDSHSLGKDTISPNAKADSVLNEGERLLELGNNWSTMEMIVMNSTKFTYDRCREYGLLTQVISHCKNKETKDLVYQEWAMYERILKKIGLLASNMVSLNYWGGSLVGPLGTATYLQILDSRMCMYKTILDIIEGQGWDDSGVPMENAERFLFDCCSTTIERIVKESDEFYSEYKGKEPAGGFYETIHETQTTIEELRPIINKWIILMDKVDYELTHDSSRHSIERAASYMMMKWASIVTER